ncbi:MAG: polyprenyl synthetase family protein, partial [Candidatus Hydrogenedentes bacterium]|nr:polyprenyl synthetase family protein [Candidatus Hydrogenedentota bacterium]
VPACLAGLPDSDCGVLKEYACNLGMAFQITDDLIDSQTSPEDENKPTFARLLGCDEARDRASRFIAAAIDVLEPFGARAHPLRALAEYVRTRTA